MPVCRQTKNRKEKKQSELSFSACVLTYVFARMRYFCLEFSKAKYVLIFAAQIKLHGTILIRNICIWKNNINLK